MPSCRLLQTINPSRGMAAQFPGERIEVDHESVSPVRERDAETLGIAGPVEAEVAPRALVG